MQFNRATIVFVSTKLKKLMGSCCSHETTRWVGNSNTSVRRATNHPNSTRKTAVKVDGGLGLIDAVAKEQDGVVSVFLVMNLASLSYTHHNFIFDLFSSCHLLLLLLGKDMPSVVGKTVM